MQLARRLLLVVVSIGWLVPTWGALMMAGSQTLELFEYFAYGGKGWPSAATGNSFPIEEFTYQLSGWLLTLGCIWLLLVGAYWAWRATAPREREA